MIATVAPFLVRRRMDSPVGVLELVASSAGLRAVLWPGEDGSRVARSLAPGRRVVVRASGPDAAEGAVVEVADPYVAEHLAVRGHLDRTEAQLGEYFVGVRQEFDLELDLEGTVFQRSAWEVLRSIPYGATMSYGQQAAALGDPAKARAVGAANGRNPISIVVPCHRVVAAGGALTGFAGGLDTKAWLLAHERRVLARGAVT